MNIFVLAGKIRKKKPINILKCSEKAYQDKENLKITYNNYSAGSHVD
jgi:hypothetical protein